MKRRKRIVNRRRREEGGTGENEEERTEGREGAEEVGGGVRRGRGVFFPSDASGAAFISGRAHLAGITVNHQLFLPAAAPR